MRFCILFLAVILTYNSLAQENTKDTIFIKYDKFLLKREKKINESNFIYKIRGSGNNGFTYFLEKETYFNLKTRKVQSLKKLLKKANVYYKKNQIDDWELSEFLGKYVVFLVKRKKAIEVQVWYEIE